MSLDETGFLVGGMGMVTCSSDNLADRIEIISSTGLMRSRMSVRTVTLTINPVTDTLHNSNMNCSVTRGMGTPTQTRDYQTITISVDSK